MTEFQQFVDEMPHGKADDFRKKICAECDITDSYFRLWANGLKVPLKYRETINRVSQEMLNQTIFY